LAVERKGWKMRARFSVGDVYRVTVQMDMAFSPLYTSGKMILLVDSPDT
jgi:hypothetical protein